MKIANRALLFTGLFALLWIFALQGGPSARPLLAELKEKSASEGLVIAGVMNRDFMVFPFSGSPFVRRFFNYDIGAGRIAPGGTAVLAYWGLEDRGIPARRFALIDAEGRVIALLNRDVVNVADFAVASDLTAVVFAGKDSATGEVGIFLGKLGASEIHMIVPLRSHSGTPVETSVAWVPDGSAVLFSRDGEVSTYDVSSRVTSVLFPTGTNPSCSPDGRWIAYRDPNGFAVIASRRGTGAKRASQGPIDGCIHWSPESEYYFVDEKVPGASPQRCSFGSCFVIYRLRDGSRLELPGTDRKDSFFGWLRGPWLGELGHP
jgi:hypothetical protein